MANIEAITTIGEGGITTPRRVATDAGTLGSMVVEQTPGEALEIDADPGSSNRPPASDAGGGGLLRTLSRGRSERLEAELDDRLAAMAPVTRTNGIAMVSPKGGVGKTTCTFLLGNLLASRLRLRVLAVDANRDFGTLASLTPDATRVQRSLADLLGDLGEVTSAAELLGYVSSLPTGLHLLAAPSSAEAMAEMTPHLYGELLDFLGSYYDVILLDLGTGIIDPLVQFGIRRADQTLLITSAEYVTTEKVLDTLRYLDSEGTEQSPDPGQLSMVLNRVPSGRSGDRHALEDALRGVGIGEHATIPHEERLHVMLDSGTYALEALPRPTRIAIKQLGATVAGRLI